jgi:serine/threonine protein kinase
VPVTGTFVYEQLALQAFLGAGAFSKVYRALVKDTGTVAAVKYLRKECWDDERARAAIIREWDVLRRLDHPHILRVHGWGTTRRGGLFLVTDYVAGGDLAAWRRDAQPGAVEIAGAVASVAEAVAAAHRQGVWHGDLKPSNVLRHADGRVILCDFGLARWAQDPGDVPRGGTAGFLCPESISDAWGPLSERSDVYGLGGLLYALLTGRPPMSGRDLPETLANVLAPGGPAPPSASRADVTPDLDDLVLHCLRKDPTERPASAAEVVQRLRIWLR